MKEILILNLIMATLLISAFSSFFFIIAFHYSIKIYKRENYFYFKDDKNPLKEHILESDFYGYLSGLLLYKLSNKRFPYRLMYVDICTKNYPTLLFRTKLSSVIYKRPFPLFQNFRITEYDRIIDVETPILFFPNGFHYSSKSDFIRKCTW